MKLLLTTLLALIASAMASSTILSKEDLPNGDWVSLHDGSGEFQLAEPTKNVSPEKAAALRAVQRRFLGYKDQLVDGFETYYDEYSQAWRLLGFYIDCNVVENGYSERRQLQDQDQETSACERYLLWAAVRIGVILRTDC